MDDAEADALVDFASGLDYESFIDDLEVRLSCRMCNSMVNPREHEASASRLCPIQLREMFIYLFTDTSPAPA